jgi:hypothetical protein
MVKPKVLARLDELMESYVESWEEREDDMYADCNTPNKTIEFIGYEFGFDSEAYKETKEDIETMKELGII